MSGAILIIQRKKKNESEITDEKIYTFSYKKLEGEKENQTINNPPKTNKVKINWMKLN